MGGTRDVDDVRPSSQHRPMPVSAASLNHNRPHAHSVSAGGVHPSYRVNRRKSSSSMAGVNIAALAAAAKEASRDRPSYINRVAEDQDEAGQDTPASGETILKEHGSAALHNSSVLVDGPPLSAMGDKPASSKSKARRASEGTRLTRSDRRRSTAGELRCDKCGKGYKHGSCLQKHLWEHTPEWSLTSKLLISKHQQVQLLEAASVLVNMNQDGPANNELNSESALQESESSDSAPASGSSDPPDDDASSRTSTPSQLDERARPWKGSSFSRPATARRQDSYNSAFSRSYQSTSGNSFAASSAPNDAGDLYYYRPTSSRRRPSTASHPESEDQDLTAAAESLVSCSLGTPKYGPTKLPPDVPPVPPLPAKFKRAPSRPTSFGYQTDVEMSDGESHLRTEHRARGRDEDDEGMFGRMEQ